LLVPLLLVYFRFYGSKQNRYETSWRNPMATLHRHSVLPRNQLLPIAGFLSVFFLFVDYFWYAALTGVSVTAATAIGNSTPLFVYCFSICFLRERLTLHKVTGVLLAIVGVTLIVFFQQDQPAVDLSVLHDQSIIAGLLVVVSSAFTAGYDVAYKYLLGAELTDTTTVLILTGLSGVLTIPMWIVGSVLVAHSPFDSLYETFAWPSSGEGVALLFLSGSLAVLFNVCMPLLLVWTSPLETSVGGMLVVPLSGAWDVVFHGTTFSSACIIGSVLVLMGYGVLDAAPRETNHHDGRGVLPA
jgi:solute carrier family 35 protein F5